MTRDAGGGPARSKMPATACARANVALVKYWGKRPGPLNLPAVGSLSLTLAGLEATASVGPRAAGAPAFMSAGQAVEGTAARRMEAFLERLREFAPGAPPLAVEVGIGFPVGAGLASSAAIFCATAAAGLSALGLSRDRRELSRLARQGSGSAARSVFGGLVEWHRGRRPDGEDSFAEPLAGGDNWPLAMAVAVIEHGPKAIPSRDAMEHVAQTSPFFEAWIAGQDADLAAARQAVGAHDLTALGTIAEQNCLRMHATCFAARPPVMYWRPGSLAVIDEIRRLRAEGVAAWFTMDAGPQVKALCLENDLEVIATRLATVPGVQAVLRARSGAGVEMIEGAPPWS